MGDDAQKQRESMSWDANLCSCLVSFMPTVDDMMRMHGAPLCLICSCCRCSYCGLPCTACLISSHQFYLHPSLNSPRN